METGIRYALWAKEDRDETATAFRSFSKLAFDQKLYTEVFIQYFSAFDMLFTNIVKYLAFFFFLSADYISSSIA